MLSDGHNICIVVMTTIIAKNSYWAANEAAEPSWAKTDKFFFVLIKIIGWHQHVLITSKAGVPTCSRADRSDVPLMLAWEGEGDGGLWCGLWCGCCSCCCCWYLLFRWSMKASLLRSMSALWRLVRASRLWAAVTVCRCSEVCTRPTLEKRRAVFPSVRYSRGYSRSSVEIMWLPPRSGSESGGQHRGKGGWWRRRTGRRGEERRGGGKCARRRWITTHTRVRERFQEKYVHAEQPHTGGDKWSRKRESGGKKNKAARGQERGGERERNGMGC